MAIGIIFAIVSLISSAVSMYASNEQAKQQEKIQRYNAEMARLRGEYEQDVIEAQADVQIEESRREISTTFNTLANRGIDITTGAPLLQLTQQWTDDLDDRNEMSRQGELAALSGANQSTLLNFQADATDNGRKINLGAGTVNAASSAAGSYYQGETFDAKLNAAKAANKA